MCPWARSARACGISLGDKHFESKDAVLAAMLIGISERLLEEGRLRVDKARSPREALGPAGRPGTPTSPSAIAP